MEQARERLADAQKIVGLVHPAVLVSAAYYAMLNAARAALSERGEYAKTHGGTWHPVQRPPRSVTRFIAQMSWYEASFSGTPSILSW